MSERTRERERERERVNLGFTTTVVNASYVQQTRTNCNEPPVRKLQFHLNIYRSADGGFPSEKREAPVYPRGPDLPSGFVFAAERRVNVKSGRGKIRGKIQSAGSIRTEPLVVACLPRVFATQEEC